MGAVCIWGKGGTCQPKTKQRVPLCCRECRKLQSLDGLSALRRVGGGLVVSEIDYSFVSASISVSTICLIWANQL